MGLHGTIQHNGDRSSGVSVRPGGTEPEQSEPTGHDGEHVPSEAAVDALDQEDFHPPAEMEQKKPKPIVSVHGQDVNEEDLGKAA